MLCFEQSLIMGLKTYECTQCQSKITGRSALREHIETIHQFPCTLCSKSYNLNAYLQRHIQSAHEGRKLPCPQCEYKATWKGSLRDHIQTIHGDKKFQCHQCDFKAPQKYKLLAHIKTVHEGISVYGPFRCEVCSKDYKTVTGYDQHISSFHCPLLYLLFSILIQFRVYGSCMKSLNALF